MLLYYFETKNELVLNVLACIGTRLNTLLAQHSAGPPVPPATFLSTVLTLAETPDIAPFMTIWTDVIARAARGEAPYTEAAPKVVANWTHWITTRLTGIPDADKPACAATILSIVEGRTLLEMASPGSTRTIPPYLETLFSTF